MKIHHPILTGLCLFLASCNTGPTVQCEPRTLTTQEVSPELFVGTWANCPYWPSDWHGDPPRPQEIYCTFRSDGTLELREVFESGNVSFDDDTTWELNAEKWILSQRKSDELIEKWDIIEITEKSLELEPGNAHSPGPWRAVSCSGPGW